MSMISQQNQAGISLGEIDRVIAGTHHDPHAVLGAHAGPDGVIVRVLRPLAKSVQSMVLPDGAALPGRPTCTRASSRAPCPGSQDP